MPLLFPNPARSGLPSYQTVAEPWHGCAVTRARIDHLRANLFNARLLTRSTLLRRQCHVVGFRVTGALDLVLGVESRFAVTRQVTRGWQTLKFDRDKPLILLARPKRFELLTPRFVVWCSIQLSYGRVLRIARETFPKRAKPPGTRL